MNKIIQSVRAALVAAFLIITNRAAQAQDAAAAAPPGTTQLCSCPEGDQPCIATCTALAACRADEARCEASEQDCQAKRAEAERELKVCQDAAKKSAASGTPKKFVGEPQTKKAVATSPNGAATATASATTGEITINLPAINVTIATPPPAPQSAAVPPNDATGGKFTLRLDAMAGVWTRGGDGNTVTPGIARLQLGVHPGESDRFQLVGGVFAGGVRDEANLGSAYLYGGNAGLQIAIGKSSQFKLAFGGWAMGLRSTDAADALAPSPGRSVTVMGYVEPMLDLSRFAHVSAILGLDPGFGATNARKANSGMEYIGTPTQVFAAVGVGVHF